MIYLGLVLLFLMIFGCGICVLVIWILGVWIFLPKKNDVWTICYLIFLHSTASLLFWERNTETFSKGKVWRASRLLELIHSDLCLVEVSSNGGSNYFITFIDDFSSKIWVYSLKNKSETCDILKSFKVYVEK